MTLYTTDYLEYYLTLVGWIVHNGIWSVLVASGVFAIPFLAIVLQEWLKARSEGADEGNKGVLSSMRIENRVWVAIVVVMFAGIPFIDVDLNIIQFDESRSQQCQVKVPQPGETGWSQSFSMLNGQSAKLPVWWAFIHTEAWPFVVMPLSKSSRSTPQAEGCCRRSWIVGRAKNTYRCSSARERKHRKSPRFGAATTSQPCIGKC